MLHFELKHETHQIHPDILIETYVVFLSHSSKLLRLCLHQATTDCFSSPRSPNWLWSPQNLLSPQVKRQGREVHQKPPTSAEVKKMVDLYSHSPIRLHGVMFK
jgi:hypothetical protein